jgi:NADH:ubiquinone oxidoreductase subunit 6 (subunit J)
LQAFESTPIVEVGEATSTEALGTALLGRFVLPFEVVSILLLAALIGAITIARKDLTPAEEQRTGAV